MTTLQPGEKRKLSELGLPTPFNVQVQHGPGVDISAFGLSDERQLISDEYIAFYNNPATPGGEISVQFAEQAATFSVNLSNLPPQLERVMFTATHDTQPLRHLPVRVQVGALSFDASPALRDEKAAMLLEIYKHAGEWRIGAVGQGFNGGLGELVTYFGGEVQAPAASTSSSAPPSSAAAPAVLPTISLSKTVNLSKGSSVSLVKGDGAPDLQHVAMGLGWDPVRSAPAKSGGLLGGLFGGGGSASIDLDASCLMFDAGGQVIDTVWFVQKRSKDGAVQHSGDNLTGQGEGDDETINVSLNAISAQIHHLVFTVNSFRGQQFTEVSRAYCRLLDTQSGKELARFDLSGGMKTTGMLMTRLSRVAGGWHLTAIGEMADGRTVKELGPTAQRYLR